MHRIRRLVRFAFLLASILPHSAFASYPSVSLSRAQWFWSSTPLFDMGDSATTASVPIPSLVATHSRLQWYNAHGVQEHDLNPILNNENGGDAERTVLEMNVLLPTGQAVIGPDDWTGVTQSLSTAGRDFSLLKYVEIWVNDFTQEHAITQGKLHIDFGRVSEDAFWHNDSVPNGQLDTEDVNGDGKLNRGETADVPFEDTGLDHLRDPQEPGYDPATNPDPDHDDYFFDPNATPLDYSGINNMENSGEGVANARPDTEDLDRNGFADFQNDYFSATIDLSDSAFVAIDVARDYANIALPPGNEIAPDNGWRMFRVPLTPEIFKRVRVANWQDVQYVRLWVNGLTEPRKYQIGGVELLDSLGRPAPRAAVLHQNAPNPFNPGTTIRFELPQDEQVSIRIFDVHGRVVRTLVQGRRPAGYNEVTWNGVDEAGKRVASGVYWCRLEMPGVVQTRAMVLTR
jgi:flagellar hook capping protein FlgD